jgi:hypothetical protein
MLLASTNVKELPNAKLCFPNPPVQPPLCKVSPNADGDHYLEGALKRVDRYV